MRAVRQPHRPGAAGGVAPRPALHVLPAEAVLSSLSHLARRAAQVARRPRLTPADAAWASTHLVGAERHLFDAAPEVDRVHGVAVARRVQAATDGDGRWIRAALLHDAGKLWAGLGLPGRVAVTAAALVAPVTAARLEDGAVGPGDLAAVPGWGRAAAYLAHGPLAASWLDDHGSDEEVVAWVRYHHRPERWPELPLPAAAVRALAASDE